MCRKNRKPSGETFDESGSALNLVCDDTGISSRGDANIIRFNKIEDARGAGVRLGGDVVNGYTYGRWNQVRGL